jgi:hypothetical protein
MNSKKTRFHDEWFAVYGYEMPPHVERLPIEQIQQAIEFGRKKYQPVNETSGNDDSMVFEDNHNNLK